MSRNTDFYMRCDGRLIKSEISGAQMWDLDLRSPFSVWVRHSDVYADLSPALISGNSKTGCCGLQTRDGELWRLHLIAGPEMQHFGWLHRCT